MRGLNSRPNGFYDAVKERLQNKKISSSLISMVKSGRRKNDDILRAIIEVQHNWQEIQEGKLISKL